MNSRAGAPSKIEIAGRKLECRTWGGTPSEKPAVVLLHEGLGSVALWRTFPQDLAARTGYCVFAYSRAGYGESDPAALPLPLDYMSREATEVLPEVLDKIGFERGILLGHSDGASIAAIYAGSAADRRIRGLCLISPHFFTEPMGLAAIAGTKLKFEEGPFAERLGRYHANPRNAFLGWSGAWLNPDFKSWSIEEFLAYIRVPVLAIQGLNDQYGTLAQIDALVSGSYAPVDVALFENCMHSPHLEQPQKTIDTVSEFLTRLERIEREGLFQQSPEKLV
jgi:pimeloyl-ACP methyl ester carboxylesterase